jgi:hypothetical protein
MADPGLAEFLGGFILGAGAMYAGLVSYTRLIAVKPRPSHPAPPGIALNPNALYFGSREPEKALTVATTVPRITEGDAPPTPPAGGLYDFAIVTPNEGIEHIRLSAHAIGKFARCPTPKQDEYHGDKSVFSKLLRVGQHYQWIEPATKGFMWTHDFRCIGLRVARMRERNGIILPRPAPGEDTPR